MSKKLKIVLYSPYVPDHYGGGERYFFSVAEYLSRNHDVSVAVHKDHLSEREIERIRQKYEEFLSLNLQNIQFITSPLSSPSSFIQKLLWTKNFDVIYYLTDGSLFFSLAKKNILHIQFPFTEPKESKLERLKLRNWNVKNTNSNFTKEVIEKSWKTKINLVHQPFVDTKSFKPAEKKSKIILHVGRFFSHLHTKRQDILVKTFIKLVDENPEAMKGWKFVLIGGVEDKMYANKIQALAKGYSIKIIHDASSETLKSYYALAQIYWHATGYGVDEYLSPMVVEHFGISTLEAMASGVIPIVINKGGQKEVVEHGVSGFLWNELDALEERTLACIQNEVDVKELSEKARARATEFSPHVFYTKLNKMIDIKEKVREELISRVSVVVPTYNGKSLLDKHLGSVIHAMRDGDELIIIDDCSTDDTVEWLVKKFKLAHQTDRAEFSEIVYQGVSNLDHKQLDITLIQQKQNERFAASCNKAVKLAKHDLIFLINNDVKPHPDVLDKLVPYFLNHRHQAHEIFGIGCLEIEKDEDGKEEKAGKNKLWFERGMFVHSKAHEFSTGETAWVGGGSGLFSKQKWEELKGFDVRYYPAYWEDIDLSFRARKKGWKVLFDSEAIVEHHHESTNSSAFGQLGIQIMSFKNSIKFTWLHSNILQKVQFFFWLPYHVLFTNRRTKGAYLKGLWQAITH